MFNCVHVFLCLLLLKYLQFVSIKLIKIFFRSILLLVISVTISHVMILLWLEFFAFFVLLGQHKSVTNVVITCFETGTKLRERQREKDAKVLG